MIRKPLANHKFKILVFFMIITMCLYYFAYTNKTIKKKFEYSDFKEEEVTPNIRNKKKILYWNNFWNDHDMYLGLGSKIFQNCPQTNCFTTSNKSLMAVEDYDAIIFHMPTFSLKHDGLPNKRNPNQKYVFFSLESALNFNYEPKVTKNYFNWTMSYRKDSDIQYPYARVIQSTTDYQIPSTDFVKGKTKKIAWFVSKCQPKKRKEYAKELEKYIPIDIFGACGTKRCSRSHESKCYKELEANYKFYLSFENSFCRDYITEKLYNVLEYNVVPVVLGGGDYSVSAPPGSLINTADFANPKDLADFLWKLDNDTESYLKYFQWKTDYVIRNYDRQNILCQMCNVLNKPLTYTVYEDVKQWFYKNCYI